MRQKLIHRQSIQILKQKTKMNNYHIYEEIGKGKYSVVYKGRKKKSIEYLAVKSLEKSRRKKLLNEVKMFADLNHNNILRFYHWYETRNHLWVILEYCPGGDLMSLIEADSKGLEEAAVKQFMRDIAQGLIYLHSKGIVYADLKPSNILLNEYGNLKLSDLGLAKRLVDLISATNVQENQIDKNEMFVGSKRGSPYYMAPELFQDGGVYSFQSDIWALGCIAYELATGQPPFISSSFSELVDLILNAEVQRVEQCSQQFNDLLKGLLEKDPTKRWSWDKIVKQAYFSSNPLSLYTIPQQPHFDNWCKKNMSTSKLLQDKLVNSTPIQQKMVTPSQTGKGVDILRLSLNVKKNMLKEDSSTSQYQMEDRSQKQKRPVKQEVNDTSKDLKLMNKDQEIHIGDDEREEEEDESVENQSNQQEQQNQNVRQDYNIVQKMVSTSPLMTANKENLQPASISKASFSRSRVEPTQSPIQGGVTPQVKGKLAEHGPGSVQLVPLDQLFTHSSDNAVKPIIGNRDIEKNQQSDAICIKDQLPFAYISPEEINKNIDAENIEQHFENIYNALASGSVSPNDKLNILNYFELIIQSSASANRLLNSAFTPLLLKLLKLGKTSAFKLRLCGAIGFLIRHATVIEPEVSQVGIIETLVEQLNSKENASVRRKAVAAFGEYLFYGATQMDEDPENPYWEMSIMSYNCLIKLLKAPSEDEIIKFYCVKTIENISSQSISTGAKFAQPEILSVVIQIFLVTKNENLKISCAVALANLVLLDNHLVDQVIYGVSLKNMVGMFMDGNARIQQALITLFNLYLLQSLNNDQDTSNMSSLSKTSSNQIQQVAINTINKLLMEESQMLASLIHLLDHGNGVTRGKAALSLMLIIKFNINTLIQLSEEPLHFFLVIDKVIRDQNDYLLSCLQHLISQLNDSIPCMIQAVTEEIANHNTSDQQDDEFSSSKRKHNKKLPQHQTETPKLKGNFAFLNVIQQFAQSPTLQPTLFSQQYLPILASLLSNSTPLTQSTTLAQAQHTIFNIMANLATNPKIIIKQQEVVINNLLKHCIDSLSQPLPTETKFLFLKLVTELISALLQEESIYDYPGFLKQFANEINKIIINQLLPLLRGLFQDQPPLPFYSLKLAAILLNSNTQLLPQMKKNKVIQQVLEMYKVSGNSITGHTLTIIAKIIEGCSLEEIIQLQVIEKSCEIFIAFVLQQQDWSYEEMAIILCSISTKMLGEFQKQSKQVVNPENTVQPQPFPPELFNKQQTSELLLQTVNSVLQLLQSGTCLCQSNLLLFLLHMTYFYSSAFSGIKVQVFGLLVPLSRTILGQLVTNNIQSLSVTNTNIHNFTLFKRSFKVMHWMVALGEQKAFKFDKKDMLVGVLERVRQSSDDRALVQAAKEIPRYLL